MSAAVQLIRLSCSHTRLAALSEQHATLQVAAASTCAFPSPHGCADVCSRICDMVDLCRYKHLDMTDYKFISIDQELPFSPVVPGIVGQ
jgi:hypothetical protein